MICQIFVPGGDTGNTFSIISPPRQQRCPLDLLPCNRSSYYVRVRIEEKVKRELPEETTPEKMINRLREVGALLGRGSTIGEATRKIGGKLTDLLPLAKEIRWDEH